LTKKYRQVTTVILLSAFAATSILQSVFPSMSSIYAQDGGDTETDTDQDVDQEQKCKVGNFGDPEDKASSSTFGFCNQQGQNNIGGSGSLGDVGIPMGPEE
jgi:hypothetical protein